MPQKLPLATPSIADYRKTHSPNTKLYLQSFNKKSNNPEEPLVTIITVVFNGEKTLQKTIQSLEAQKYKNIEYIIIDGGSTDGTLEIIKSHKKIVSFWVSEKDRGIYDAMNKGISIANGELIALLNADDFYTPDAVSNIVDCYNKDGGDIIHGDVNYIKNGRRLFTLKPPANLNNLSFLEMPLNHPASFVKRQIYEELGLYKTSYKIAADWEFMLRAFILRKTFKYIPKVLTNYTLEGVSSNQASLGQEEIFRTLSELKLFHPVTLNFYYKLARLKLYIRESNSPITVGFLAIVRKLKSRTIN